MTPAKLRLAMAAMSQRTVVSELCKELGVTRVTLYRHLELDGVLRQDGQKLKSCWNGEKKRDFEIFAGLGLEPHDKNLHSEHSGITIERLICLVCRVTVSRMSAVPCDPGIGMKAAYFICSFAVWPVLDCIATG